MHLLKKKYHTVVKWYTKFHNFQQSRGIQASSLTSYFEEGKLNENTRLASVLVIKEKQLILALQLSPAEQAEHET